MDEDVLTAFTLDKSVAFVVVKPLHRADFGHRLPPCPQLEDRATSAVARGQKAFCAMFGPLAVGWPLTIRCWPWKDGNGQRRTANGERLPVVGRSLLVVRRDPLRLDTHGQRSTANGERLPDQRSIDANLPETEGLIEGDGRAVEIIHK